MAELLIRRSDLTAGRPILTMCGELVGYNNAIVLKQPGKEFRGMRREINLAVGKSHAASRDKLLHRQDLGQYMLNLLSTPDLLFEHNRWLIGTYTLAVGYGHRPTKYNDAFITAAERALFEFVDLIQPGAWIVDIFPFLKHLLLRLPFSNYKKNIAKFKESQKALSITPYNMVKEQLAKGTALPSVCASLIQKYQGENLTEQEETHLAWIVGNIYAGGADTSVSTLCSFYLAMCLSPASKLKAQTEIDQFTERTHRCPSPDEKEQFPYLCALITELYRWGIVAPLGIPHAFVEEAEYGGYTIPKGTSILTNAWAIAQDPEIFPEPEDFQPERFLGSEKRLDPRDFAFGAGRRICPGIDFADAMLFLSISTVLAVFDINPIPECLPSYAYKDRFSKHPEPFKCSITLRSAKSRDWIDACLAE